MPGANSGSASEPAQKMPPMTKEAKKRMAWWLHYTDEGGHLSAAEIARQLSLSPRTVKYYYKEIEDRGGLGVFKDEEENPPQKEDLPAKYARMLEPNIEGFEEFFTTFSEEEYLPKHMRHIIQSCLEGSDQLILNIPPGHAKSTFFSSWLPLWLIVKDRNTQILNLGLSWDLAMKYFRLVATHLEYNKELVKAFGRFRPLRGDAASLWQPNQGKIIVAGRTRAFKTGDATLFARGRGQTILGFRFDLLIADDITDPDIDYTLQSRNKLDEWFRGTILSRLSPDGRAWLVGQRVHVDDLYGRLEQERDDEFPDEGFWNLLRFPAVSDWSTGDVLWPQEWPVDKLKKVRKRLTAPLFETRYQQNPRGAGDAPFKEAMFYGDEKKELPGCLDIERMVGQSPKWARRSRVPSVRALAVDPSETKNWGFRSDVAWDRKHFKAAILKMVKKPMNIHNVIGLIKELHSEFNLDYIVVEENLGAHLLDDPEFVLWTRRKRIKVKPHRTGRNKTEWKMGVASLATDFEWGRVRFPWGDEEAQEMTRILLTEALNWPGVTSDDLLMTIWFLKYNHAHLYPPYSQRTTMDGENFFRVPPSLEKGFPWAQRTPIKQGR